MPEKKELFKIKKSNAALEVSDKKELLIYRFKQNVHPIAIGFNN